MNRLADEEQASKDAEMLAARDGDDELLVDVDVEWDAISGGDGDLGGRR